MSRCETAVSILLLVANLHLLSGAARAESVSRVRLLADNCAVCHGTDCTGSFSIPGITGMRPQEFMFKMNGFFFGDENATVMGRVAKGLNKEDLSELSYYLSQLSKRSTQRSRREQRIDELQ